METFKNLSFSVKKKVLIAFSVLFSGICWYFSNGLSGDYWFLLWFAPIPILIFSLRVSAKQAFLIAFIAYLVGRLSWFSYLVMVATLIPAIIFTVLLPFIFALILVLTRWSILKLNSWISVFAFPLFFTSFEFLMITFSPDGTAASIAYSQANVLPVIQIASITGILGITFIVTFIPSAIALAFHFHKEKRQLNTILGISGTLIVLVIAFGLLRLNTKIKIRSMKAGMIVLDEKFHQISQHPDFAKEKITINNYVCEISKLAAQGAEIIVLPERAVNIDSTTEKETTNVFSNTAKQNGIYLVIGYTNLKHKTQHNSAMVIDPNGKFITDFNKAHLVTGLENQFTPGHGTGLFTLNNAPSGTAICKDLDFPSFIRNYGKSKIVTLAIPAWDFEVDAWLHSRMAILRGVENGFSELRAARQGRLTISDCYGKVISESDCSKGNRASLVGQFELLHKNTLYAHFGDWFGILNLILAIVLICPNRIKKLIKSVRN